MIGNIPKKIVSFRRFIKRHKRYFVSFIGIIIGIFLVLVLWKVPQWQINQFYIPTQELAQRENEYRKTLTQIIGGTAVLLGLYLTWLRIRTTERNVEIASEGQITERFTRAIEQLGNKEDLVVRLGGIYALERIAKDSEKDYWTIIEVLTAYVRENTKIKTDTGIKPSTDIQAILTVIGRREQTHGKGEDLPLDLHGANIRGANLRGANLNEAHLEGAYLYQAHLEGASLEGAYLWGTDLEGAIGLTKEQIKKAHIDKKTKLPDYLQGLKTEKNI